MEERPVPANAEDGNGEEEGEERGISMADLEFLCCLLQPRPKQQGADGVGGGAPDPGHYVGMRRLLLHRKAELSPSAIARRKEWRCGGRGYVAYRNFIRRPRNWESRSTTPGHSGRWASSPGPQSILFDVESWSSSRDFQGVNNDLGHRASFSSSIGDLDRPVHFAEPAYSFVGMHCIFDSCKASVTILKFGHMSSDLLAYGASDGSLTVCRVSETPSILMQLRGHSKDVTGEQQFPFSWQWKQRNKYDQF